MYKARAISDWIEKIENCPVFEPSETEFEEPLKYIDKIAPMVAHNYGEQWLWLLDSGQKRWLGETYILSKC